MLFGVISFFVGIDIILQWAARGKVRGNVLAVTGEEGRGKSWGVLDAVRAIVNAFGEMVALTGEESDLAFSKPSAGSYPLERLGINRTDGKHFVDTQIVEM